MPTRKELKDWLDNIAKTEGVITIVYEGGNDSGGATFEVNGNNLREDYPNTDWQEVITELALDNIGYGGFAGDFNCGGTITYDPVTGSFTGMDYYSQDEGDSIDLKDGDEDYPHKRIPIRVPKHLWFDAIELNTEGYYDEGFGVKCAVVIQNGPVTQEHADLESTLSEYFEKQVIETFNRITDVNINYAYNEITLVSSDFVEEGEFMVGYVTELDFSREFETAKEISFTLIKTDEDGTTETDI